MPAGAVLVAHITGEIDLSNVEDIRTELVEAVEHDTECLVLDLTETRISTAPAFVCCSSLPSGCTVAARSSDSSSTTERWCTGSSSSPSSISASRSTRRSLQRSAAFGAE